MPIVDIELIDKSINGDSEVPEQTLQQLADGLGEIFGSRDSGTWVKLHRLAGDHYAENQTQLDKNFAATFVTIIKRTLPAIDELEAEAKQITKLVADSLRRPVKNTHIIYEPTARHRIAFGGELVK